MATTGAEYSKRFRERHPEADKQSSKRYYENNRELVKSKRKARYKPEQRRIENLRDKYGITPEQYDELLSYQKGVCAICLEPPADGEKLAVDHDHVTGKVRGLLHRVCNAAIGFLGDDAEILIRAAAYLKGNNVNSSSL